MATSPNVPEYSVAELAGAVKRTVENAFGLVRVRGELSRFRAVSSGHWYGTLKDERANLDIVMWKGVASALRFRPEDGMEVVAVGKLTTYPGKSSYQLVIERLEPAGVGALLAQLEARREKLRAEGLFARERKKPLPFLPAHIGIVTSPTGAVIRDILHRLADRFPRRVTLWPVPVQGEGAAPRIAAAVAGLNALPVADRPDLLIVARGGGSVEDLWAFNEEIVVRAAAASVIPLISAVGHETDTALIDYAADRRAPTPTAAAEMAVPVRAELLERVGGAALRLGRAERRARTDARERLAALRLPRPAALTGAARQRLDDVGDRLPRALSLAAARERARLERVSALLRPQLLQAGARRLAERTARADAALTRAAAARLERSRGRLARPGVTPNARLLGDRAGRGTARLDAAARRLAAAGERRLAAANAALARPAASPNARLLGTRLTAARARLDAGFRLLASLSPDATLARGYAIVTDRAGALLPTRAAALAAGAVTLRFADGAAAATLDDAGGGHRSGRRGPARNQGSLFDA